MIKSSIVVPFLVLLCGVNTAFGANIPQKPTTADRVDAVGNVITKLVDTLTHLQDEIEEVKSKVKADDDTEKNIEEIISKIKAEEVKNDISSNPVEKPVFVVPNHNILLKYVRKAVDQSDVKFTKEDNETIKAAFRGYIISKLPLDENSSLIAKTFKNLDNLNGDDLVAMLRLYSENEVLLDEMSEDEFVGFINLQSQKYDARNVNDESDVDDVIKTENTVKDVPTTSLMARAAAELQKKVLKTKFAAPLRRATEENYDEEDRQEEKILAKTKEVYMAAKEQLDSMYGRNSMKALQEVMDNMDVEELVEVHTAAERTKSLIENNPDISIGDILKTLSEEEISAA